jgi:hypothetical protein
MSEPASWGPDAGTDEATLARIEAEHSLALAACQELDMAAGARMEPWSGRQQAAAGPESDADQLVALELARATKTFRGAIELCRRGYGEQAAMLNRSLFEGMAMAHWIHANPQQAGERFREAQRFNQHLTTVLIDDLDDWEWDVEEEALEATRLEDDEPAAMEKKFGKYAVSEPWVHENTVRVWRVIRPSFLSRQSGDLDRPSPL